MSDGGSISFATNLTADFVRRAVSPSANGEQRRSGERAFSNFVARRNSRSSSGRGKSIAEITHELYELTGEFPKRVGDHLFAVTAAQDIVWLESPHRLFAWVESFCKVIWARGKDKVPQERFFAHLQMTAEAFDSVERVPHFPSLPGHFYLHAPLPETDGHYLTDLLQRLSPATEVDAALLKAFILTPFWGGRCGARPVFVLTGDDGQDPERGRGIGKSRVVEIVGELVGGLVEVSPQQDIDAIKRRLLSPEASSLRLVRIDNIKTHRFSWGDLEGLITAPVISGHRLYHGEGRRPNTLTWALTLNGASLSTDMAQRAVIIHLRRPVYDSEWESSTRRFIEGNRWNIIADILSDIRRNS